MTQASLSRGSTSISFQIQSEQVGGLGVAIDVGKPKQRIFPVSATDPKVRDDWSAVEQITVLGLMKGDDAHSRANSLVEDLVKPHSGGEPLQLDVTSINGITSVFEVGVPSENACELAYNPGEVNRVDVRLTLPAVSETVG